MHYDGKTVDISPNWSAMGKGNSVDRWKKVHPDLTSADYLARVNATTDRCKVEVHTVDEMVRKK